MCIDKGTKKKYKHIITKAIVGYKVFDVNRFDKELTFWFRQNNGSMFVPRKKWIKASYGTGFHVFKNRKNAISWWGSRNCTVRKIKAREVTHYGKQCSFTVFLAQEIYVP